jgi:hypothetical protein
MQYYDVGHFHSDRSSIIILGDLDLSDVLANILYVVPKDIIDDVLNNCVFLMLNKMQKDFPIRACFIHKRLIAEKNILAFCEELYSLEDEKKVHMVLHEIAHYVLDHIDIGLSHDEYYKGETEANDLVEKWINAWEKHFKELYPL